MTKVFVSSTVFDLLDVRAEVECQLREMRLIPVLSGSASSGFQPATDQNSIETCLINLRQCDSVIVILSQRYGPSLKSAGFDDVSATHLEYQEAKRLGKPIRMYVRDRLEADYAVHRRNKNSTTKLLWVEEQEDQRLFELLGEHRQLAKDKEGSNWFDVFRDSIELKTLIMRDFGPLAARLDLEGLVMDNKVPIVDVDVDIEPPASPSSCAMTIRINFKNVGTTPAYRLSWNLDGAEKDDFEFPMLAPQQKTVQALVYGHYGKAWERGMTVTYCMAHGHRVRDTYRVGFRMLRSNIIVAGATCLSKTYHVATDGNQPFSIVE